MTIIIFVLVLFVTVLVHEWGHFYAARKSGMHVEEFGFGIPPKLFSWKKGGVVYSINLLPIGGFVRIAGENGLEKDIPKEKQFDHKPWYLKSIVLIAGVFMNLVLAFVLFTISFSIGMPGIREGGTPTITSVSAGTLASESGLKTGYVVENVFVDGKDIKPLNTETLRNHIVDSKESVEIEYFKDGNLEKVFFDTKDIAGDVRIGVAIEPIGNIKLSFIDAIKNAFYQTIGLVVNIFYTLGKLISSLFGSSTGIGGLMGPVGLAREVGGALNIGFAYLLAFTAVISVNLAVLNILPFPALDGGRLVVVLLEAIFRKRFSPAVVGIIHAVGFILLLVLMVVLTIGDILKVI